MDIVFTFPSHKYDSYVDYYKLVRLAGYETCLIKEIDFNRRALYIICPTNREFPTFCKKNGIDFRKTSGVFVFWQLERPCAFTDLVVTAPVFQRQVDEYLESVHFLWTPHRYLSLMDTRAIHVQLGSDERLRDSGWNGFWFDKKYDFALMSYWNGRRNHIYSQLAQKYKVPPNCQGPERDIFLNESWSMLTIHQTPSPITEPQRISIAAAWRMPFLTEGIGEPWPMQRGDYLYAPYESFVQRVGEWMEMPAAEFRGYGERLFQRFAVEYTFSKLVEMGVEETVRRLEL